MYVREPLLSADEFREPHTQLLSIVELKAGPTVNREVDMKPNILFVTLGLCASAALLPESAQAFHGGYHGGFHGGWHGGGHWAGGGGWHGGGWHGGYWHGGHYYGWGGPGWGWGAAAAGVAVGTAVGAAAAAPYYGYGYGYGCPGGYHYYAGHCYLN
jgi:hypothetical protein